jgi:hypothetical protein
MVLTALVLMLAIKGIVANHTKSEWPIPTLLGLHGWPATAMNVLFYGNLCWLAFSFMRGTVGRECIFIAGWFASIVLWPLRVFGGQWTAAARLIGALGLAVALLAAIALLCGWSDAVNGKPEAT